MNNFKRIPILDEIIEGEYKLIDWKYINNFAKLTTDYNPIHVDIDYITKETLYTNPIAHGQIGVSFITALLGNTFRGIMIKNQNLNFLKPVMINSEIKPIIRCSNITEINHTYKNLEITFNVKLVNNEGIKFISGKMIMFLWGEKR